MDIAEAKEKVQSFVQERELTFTILLDEETTAARTYLVRGIPTTFVIDREGVIQAEHTGPMDGRFIDGYVQQFMR